MESVPLCACPLTMLVAVMVTGPATALAGGVTTMLEPSAATLTNVAAVAPKVTEVPGRKLAPVRVTCAGVVFVLAVLGLRLVTVGVASQVQLWLPVLGLPVEFTTGGADCSAVVIWTKQNVNRPNRRGE